MSSLLLFTALAAPQAVPGTITDLGPDLDFDVRVLAVDTNEGCDVGDVDRDGLPDIVAGRLWFRAPEFTPRPLRELGEFGADYSLSCGEFLHDVDGDGWLDVLSIPFVEPELCWYRNPGAAGLARGKLWAREVLVDTGERANEMAWLRDMDGDGALDFVVNHWVVGRPMSYWKLALVERGAPIATRGPSARRADGAVCEGRDQKISALISHCRVPNIKLVGVDHSAGRALRVPRCRSPRVPRRRPGTAPRF